MEYRSNNSKHISKSDLNDHLFCYWNKFKWMFRHRFGNGISGFIYCSHCNCITVINLCGWIKYAHCQWCSLLSMEYRTDNSEHYGESKFNHYLFCNRNEC